MFLVNSNNSCYIDVVLMSLLQSDFFIYFKKILEKNIGKELTNILITMYDNNESNCNSLRKFFLKNNVSQFSNYDANDSSEVLYYIFLYYNVENTIKHNTVFYTNDKNLNKIYSEKNEQYTINNASPIILLDTNMLNSIHENINISQLLRYIEDSGVNNNTPIFDDKKYTRKIKLEKVVKSDCIIFHLERLCKTQNIFIKKEIDISENISIDTKQYNLKSIIMWNSGHYNSFIKINNYWYFYDDMGSILKQYNNFNDVINCQVNQPKKFGVLIFYC